MTKMNVFNGRQFEILLKSSEKNPSLAKGFRMGSIPYNLKQH